MAQNRLYYIYAPSQTLNSSALNFTLPVKNSRFIFSVSAAPSGATINPGIIEMQMPSVTAPRLGGGQVAHFIMLLSCCPLWV